MRDVVIVDSVRTGLAKSHRGSFNQTRPDDMVAHLIKAILARNPKLDPAEIGDCIVGAGLPEGPQGMNIGRTTTILADLPVSVSGQTVSRYCSSGLQAISTAANQIASGFDDIIIAGGAETISLLKTPNMMGAMNPGVGSRKPGIYLPMGQTAETVATRYNVTRESQDQMALTSQQRTARAQEEGLFKDEIIPMDVKWIKKDKITGDKEEISGTVDSDECNRPTTTIEALSSLPASFSPTGTVTAGNSSQLADGASMTLLMSADRAAELGFTPLAYFRGFVVAGCEPDEMGIGPVFAVPKLLKAAGLTLDDIDIIELNEAFASQAVYCRDTLGIDPAKLNPNGGAIAVGHPYGMTGSRLVGHAARELQRKKQKYAIITMCVGGGMGAAGLIEVA
ncbi:MAG: acetyl-CoA C-acyltransferase [Gammaproteobacteria bacterium]|nr:MAG: acetyl-CoA C-acyltransferase [Gammaproteobacteria bacterium]